MTAGTGRQRRWWHQLQRTVGRRVRAVTDASIGAGLAGTTARLAELHARLDRLEQSVAAANLAGHADLLHQLPIWAHRHALAVEAQTQRVEECLAYLVVQHEAVRDVLDRLGPNPAGGPDSNADPP